MTSALRSVARKFGALGLLAAILAGVVLGVVLPALERLRDLDARISNSRDLLSRLGSNSTNTGTSATTKDLEALYLPGETDAVRLAGLQAVLTEAAKANNIKLASVSTSDSGERGGVRTLGVRTQFTSELAPLQRLLYDLEKDQRTLFVDQISIARTPTSTGSDKPPTLDVSFTVSGAVPAKEN